MRWRKKKIVKKTEKQTEISVIKKEKEYDENPTRMHTVKGDLNPLKNVSLKRK